MRDFNLLVPQGPKAESIYTNSSHLDSRVAVWLILSCRPHDFYVLMAPVCSSWVGINQHTSKRSICNPGGDVLKEYIQAANSMCSRLLASIGSQSCLGAEGSVWIALCALQVHLPLPSHNGDGRILLPGTTWIQFNGVL